MARRDTRKLMNLLLGLALVAAAVYIFYVYGMPYLQNLGGFGQEGYRATHIPSVQSEDPVEILSDDEEREVLEQEFGTGPGLWQEHRNYDEQIGMKVGDV